MGFASALAFTLALSITLALAFRLFSLALAFLLTVFAFPLWPLILFLFLFLLLVLWLRLAFPLWLRWWGSIDDSVERLPCHVGDDLRPMLHAIFQPDTSLWRVLGNTLEHLPDHNIYGDIVVHPLFWSGLGAQQKTGSVTVP